MACTKRSGRGARWVEIFDNFYKKLNTELFSLFQTNLAVEK